MTRHSWNLLFSILLLSGQLAMNYQFLNRLNTYRCSRNEHLFRYFSTLDLIVYCQIFSDYFHISGFLPYFLLPSTLIQLRRYHLCYQKGPIPQVYQKEKYQTLTVWLFQKQVLCKMILHQSELPLFLAHPQYYLSFLGLYSSLFPLNTVILPAIWSYKLSRPIFSL